MSIKTELANTSEDPSITNQNLDEGKYGENKPASSAYRDMKSKYGISFYNKSSGYTKSMKPPHSKRKIIPVPRCMIDTSAKVVLSERNVEIKDLESKVKFLKSKIKEFENENKTLQNIQAKQERELKKFKEGVTDIPALLRSHKEEIKAYESTICSIRKELRDCQKEVKLRNESLLKKDNQFDKLCISFKENEKLVHENSSEIKMLKSMKKDLEDENKALNMSNNSLKKENDDLCKQIKEFTLKIQKLEEDLNKENDLNKNLENELIELKVTHEKILVEEANLGNIQDCGNESTADDLPSEDIDKAFCTDDIENEIENIEKFTVDDTSEQNLCNTELVEKTKNDFIHNFKGYQHFHNSLLKNCDARSVENAVSNIKLLPPLKTPSKVSSTSIVYDCRKKDCFSSADVNFIDNIKYQKDYVSTNDFPKRFFTINYEIDKSEDIINDTHDSTIKLRNSFDFSLNDGREDWQDQEFRKDIFCIKKTDVNKLKNSRNHIYIPDNITEARECEHFSKSLEKYDNSFCENLKKCSDVLNKSLEKEENSYITETPKDVRKHKENSVNGKCFQCKSTTDKYKTENHKHRNTFLNHSVNTHPTSFCRFNEKPKQKFSENEFEMPWWGKW